MFPKAFDEYSVVELWQSEMAIVKLVQKDLHPLLNSSNLQQFSAYVDGYGVIRVGGDFVQIQTPDFVIKGSFVHSDCCRSLSRRDWSWWQRIYIELC